MTSFVHEIKHYVNSTNVYHYGKNIFLITYKTSLTNTRTRFVHAKIAVGYTAKTCDKKTTHLKKKVEIHIRQFKEEREKVSPIISVKAYYKTIPL